MTMSMVALLVVTHAALVLLAVWLFRRVKTQNSAILHLAGQSAQVDVFREAARVAERARVETVEKIAEIERERNDWKEKYYRAGIGHGAAQTMLMREITRLSHVAKSGNLKNAEISRGCKLVVEAYEKEILGDIPPEERHRIAGGTREKPVDTSAAEGVSSPQPHG